jgi:predicted ferric reductase
MNGHSTGSISGVAATTARSATAAANTAYAVPVRKNRRLAAPRVWPIKDYDVYALLGGNALIILAMWVRHGNLHELATPAGIVTAIGELAALYGTYLVLIQLILMSRSPWLDQVFGQDRITAAHRWVGFGAIWLLFGHFIFTTVGYAMADGSGPVDEAVNLLVSYPWVLWSGVALVLFAVVGVTTVRAARRAASYETWYLIHLTTYVAIALGFMHQLLVGVDFVTDPIARAYWIALYVIAVGLIVLFRFGQPMTVSYRHRLRVANVVREGPGVVSIYLTGSELERLPVLAGQWFRLRFMTSGGWWRAHPFSISAAPNGRYLRFTIKDLGDYTRLLQGIKVGTSVFVEGPYGVFTGARRTKARVLLVAGGIGITPLRALLEELPAARGNMTLLYRASHEEEVVFRRELDELASLRGATVHYLVGRRGSPQMPSDPLDPKALRQIVPDIKDRDIYVCGPAGMMERVLGSLHRMRIPDSQIHYERFAF